MELMEGDSLEVSDDTPMMYNPHILPLNYFIKIFLFLLLILEIILKWLSRELHLKI